MVGHAKNAWNNERPSDEYPELILEKEVYYRGGEVFNEQDIFEVHEFTFTQQGMRVIK